MTRAPIIFAAALLAVAFAPECRRGGSLDTAGVAELTSGVLVLREQYPDTAAANPRIRDFLRERGATEAELERALAGLADKPERFRAVLDSIQRRLSSGKGQEPR